MSSRRAQTLPPHIMEDKPQRGKCLTGLCVLWKILTCLVSHAALVLLVVCYCVGGAYLFQHLEKPHEIEVKKGIQNIRYNLTDKIWKFSDNTSVLSESDWIENVEKDLKSFEKQILTAMKSNGWDGDEDITKTQWTFAGSLFYSIIVITTIGYGHISPHTDWGKVTTIFYAIMGIPLMLLCLSNIGDVMATSFRFIYWRVCCYVCTRKSRPRRRSRPQPLRSEYPQRQRSQLASLRRSNKRGGQIMDMGPNIGLPHAHSDPELRHVNQRDFDASRSKLHDLYYDDMHRDGCHCPCHAHEPVEDRRYSRGRWDYDTSAGPARHSIRSERWSRGAPPTEEQYVRYTQSLPRGRAASRRMRAKTVDPHMHDGNQQRANYMRAQQQPVTALGDDEELIRKMPIITNRYAIKHLKRETANDPSQNKLRSQSMPRALHPLHRDSLAPPLQNDGDMPRSKRSRAMSVMPRNPPYSQPHNSPHAKYIELSDLRPSQRPSPECLHCCSDYYAPPARDYYAGLAEPHHHYQSSYHHHSQHQHQHQHQPQQYHHHQQQHPSMSYQGAHRDSRKAIIRQSRAEKLPPSPRIMSPMGFAVKRQTRRISSFEYDDDSSYGMAPDYYGDMAEKNRPVPIWLCVFLVISYILGGAMLFAYWEQWSFLDSAYFCFITLTTIGFGDFVPAKGVKDESEQSIAYCSLYLLFGIALLAMSFNLVQEEFIANVKEVARRLGIIKEEEEDED